MDLSAMALIAILVLVILALPLCPSWFMWIPVLIGVIASSWYGRRRSTEDQGLPIRAPVPAGDDQSPAGDASRPAGDHQPSAPAPDPAGGASPPPGPPPACSAPPPAVDPPVPSGKERSEPEAFSALPSRSPIEREVFLNFRGSDTRMTFTDHLYSRLVGLGISVFKDDGELHVGEELTRMLEEAIVRSRVYIPIFSKDYASSKWCLRELVKMWECRKLYGQNIIPIFYDVSPSDVIHQTGYFGRAFDLHKTRVDSNTIKTWKEVLREIGELHGYSGNLYKGYEGELIEEVVVDVAKRLRDDDVVAADKLVGIDLPVQEMMRRLGVAYSKGRVTEVRGEDVRVVVICGLPGVGKTTLAKVVFNKMYKLFDAHSFLPEISSKGVQFSRRMLIADLQKQVPAPLESSGEGIKEIASLCRNAKVLIVLDDVDEKEQIKALAGKLTWFGSGSRIIVTTNKREILSAFDIGADDRGTVEKQEVEPMSYDHALELFRRHAFERDPPEDVSEYDSLSIEIVKAIGGLPSVIVDHAASLRRNMNKDIWLPSVIVDYAASLRRNMNKDIWRSTLDSLQKHPEDRPAAFQVSDA